MLIIVILLIIVLIISIGVQVEQRKEIQHLQDINRMIRDSLRNK